VCGGCLAVRGGVCVAREAAVAGHRIAPLLLLNQLAPDLCLATLETARRFGCVAIATGSVLKSGLAFSCGHSSL